MTPERYRQIGEIYHAVLEVDGEKRGAFLDRTCAGDEVLRSEVESLIASHEQASDFIATPALAVAAGMLSRRDSLVGQKIANFHVLSLIGEGGMGEVYLAEDTRLGRRVALKLLSPAFTSDADRMRRFTQEARAASALNHPNILTVHEIGRANGFDFIATEFIEGETLRTSMAQRRLRLTQALDVAAQVAGALAAAHAAGVVHRDIKPENIMLRPDGYVKVLDFGLAKLAGPGLQTGNEAATVARVETNPGVVMGTVQYMSPEQARGLPVDARTDVWSLGIVLYEMIANRPPFEGETQSDTIVSILDREPKPLTLYAPEAPAELERIVTKALAKDKEERYRTAKDMAIDLRRLRRRLEVQVEIELSSLPESIGETAAVTGDQVVLASAQGKGVTQNGLVGAAAPTSSLEFAVTEIRQHKSGVALASVLLMTTLVGGGYGLYRLLSRNKVNQPAPLQTMKITRLTNEGTAREAAISRDGRYVAYVLRDAGKETLRVHQVATNSDLAIVPATEGVCLGLTFSPDGDYVYYVMIKERSASVALVESRAQGTLYQVPVLPGASRKLIADVDSAITFSPDGSRLAFVRSELDRDETAIIVANSDGSEEHILAARPSPDYYLGRGRYGGGPAWSPDGKVIACVVGRFDHQQVVAVSATDGAETPVGSQSLRGIGRMSWLPDGSGLLMVGVDLRLFPQLFEISYPTGEVRKITNDLTSYHGVSLDADARSLVTVQTELRTPHLWVMTPGEDSRDAKKILSIRGTGEGSWTADDRIVYVAMANDRWNLWVANHDGTEQKQLTAFTNQVNVRPSVCPSGRHIVFVSDRAGPRNIWRVDIDGSNLVRLTSAFATWPTCSPDSRWVVYSSPSSGKPSLWKMPFEGGDPIQLTRNTFVSTAPSISPDGTMIAFADRDVMPGSLVKIVVIPFEGGDPVKTFDLTPSVNLDVPVRWAPDGRALTYVDTHGGVPNVWSQPFEGGTPKPITDFSSDQIYTFDWSRDGKIALWRGTPTRNVVLISDFR
jgi:serine/threonine protein kinase/Tol biopolymer transport system component